jgi:serine/threonine protein kinase
LNINRLFKEAIDACLDPDPINRPSIDSLLRFSMFKLAPSNPSILQRKRISSSQPPKPKKVEISPIRITRKSIKRNIQIEKTISQKKSPALSKI